MSEEQQAAQQEQPLLKIEKIYVKDLSLEVPNSPQIFLEREAPQVDVQLHTDASTVSEGYYEAVLTVTVTAKLGEKTMFLVEAAQAGVFQIQGIPADQLPLILAITCQNMLFPYARETVSDVVTRAGFPPVLLNPVSFESLYQQQQQAPGEAEKTGTH